MTKTFKYVGESKKARMGDVLFVKGKPVEVDNGTMLRKLEEHPQFEEVKEKDSKARSPKNDAKQS
ncbi:hypothetical protein Pan258_01860 [Symmachiella dynata]|uniref:hypothetical protein n=1 Tax=Symmachiella dynata TaxID=2527995 RepID=UPI00118A3835|nr:hypothetical protein [Symmachiella dynata]QDT46169.1 hypothetical protein Pan258_01860 [Symmachiella dynata]